MVIANLTLTELDINAIGAALDERSHRLSARLVKHRSEPQSQSRDYTIECIEDAIRDTIRARLLIAAAVVADEEPTFDGLREADTAAIWHEYLDR